MSGASEGARANGRKAIFITGAASGMGLETARLFANHGWFVGGVDVNDDGLARLKDELGAENCFVQRLDVTDREAYRATLDAFAQCTGGKLDLLYNNAGIGRGGPFADQPWDDVLAVVQVNFVGVLIGIHLAIPLLKATPGSMCFTTSSSSATYGMPMIAVYSATKHAVKGLTEALAIELKPYGVRVADVLPALIDTPILPQGAAASAPKSGVFRAIPPREVAETVWEAYHSDKLHWYVPRELVRLDHMATLQPERTRDEMAAGKLFATIDAEVAAATPIPIGATAG
ncbi:SDR family oxidoreductase [Sphingomonas sp.]|jgi:NAD(P)-dependent dehydrogenase (short-subunit alcohol dehydrogenase family)|uniref:SDR family oxidoreductase n=1 Tax=Sphingomonas sp. TaxID=28214 RepID=UPI0026054BFF|nr:SDR family oxidoreductase [Sphingomonas sp.]MDF2494843.1 short-chain dehydrogenase/reductase [Sphingomonas sp.]